MFYAALCYAKKCAITFPKGVHNNHFQSIELDSTVRERYGCFCWHGCVSAVQTICVCVYNIKAVVTDGSRPRPRPLSNAPH